LLNNSTNNNVNNEPARCNLYNVEGSNICVIDTAVFINHTLERNEQVSTAQPAQQTKQAQQHKLPNAIPYSNK